MKKVAIIGSGISGVSAAYYLNKLGYEVSLFEAGSYFGGHTNTRDVNIDGTLHHVDTGFLVHNNRTYPNLINFFDELEIETHPSEMSFSVMRLSDNLTWAGSNLMTFFAQTKNIFRPRFYFFLKEVLRFNKNAQAYLEESKQRGRMSLGELLVEKGYSQDFQDWYLLPMGGCIWSSPTTKMLDFPAYTFLTFCQNHGLLQIFDRPQWKTVVNGCQTYVKKALSGIERKFLNEAVLSVHKEGSHLIVKTAKREEAFDYCFFCTHPPQTLEILKDSEKDLEACLQKFLYQPNTAVLHMDESILPKKKSVWSAWNYLSAKREDSSEAVSVSYLINKLQELVTKKAVIVTLNPSVPIKKEKTVEVIQYEHPLFSAEAVEGQEQMKKMQGRNNVYFSGAWMRYGFHEDGILSTKEAINAFLRNENKKSEQLEIL